MNRIERLKKVGNIAQLASIKAYEMTGGRETGTKAFDVSTGGGLEFTVLDSHGMDIYSAKYKGVNLSFLSKAGIAGPEHSAVDADFQRNFQGGLLYTC
jgi:hypothetical protein